ncbi:MAG: rRNA pseudouridine synthase [Gammaproteobacteria bacterium]|nr:MAG: rRNA pseudouridine synthase [Gammaproteobacteria bacterium]
MARSPARTGHGRRAAPGSRGAAAARERAPLRAGASAERLQKMLARAGLASRREAEAWIRAGRLTVNGTVAELGARVAPRDEVRLDGRVVRARAAEAGARAFLCHRSPGEPLRARAGRRFIAVSPMPRVDGGLELVSSDGALAMRLQRAVHALRSEFGVRVRGELSAAQLEGIRAGALDSGARLAVERCEAAGGEAANRWYTLGVQGASGKQVRQLFERQGALVSRVLRTQLGAVRLERSLVRGQFRALTQEELRGLLPDYPASAEG